MSAQKISKQEACGDGKADAHSTSRKHPAALSIGATVFGNIIGALR